ncbi:2-keto-4-pentenoate hydratase [Burkholderia aenigmatica]|uniref:2-keto-4-pentenoate hydratase n=1 Tax=Burkholderia aenigmatica TaxID=2015348 RepID=UPI00265267B8|nr:fumarylacetoacetate hydrolase family protein [Burkholderia aenigmatica]MDN7874919.1 fumarylacetoacetate hydrolase family protein [Burkholderia aenigmatica]
MCPLPDVSRIHAAADALRNARATRTPVEPIAERFGIAGLAAAYAVAEMNTAARTAAGARIIGRKIGLTSLAVQRQLGVDQPDFGVLFDDMEYLDGDDVPMDRLLQPKIETEVAFVVGRDLDDHAPSYSRVVSSLAYALPALEIVDSAIADWRITLEDTVADNASCGAYVLGHQPVSLGRLSLGELGMTMTRRGDVVSTGVGAACLGHPLRAVYWLARTMARHGQGLREGDVILSGALGPMVAVASGDTIHAQIGALGSVHCRLVKGAAQ